MALKDITTIEETEQLSADANFYTEDGGAFRRAGVDAVKDALGLALESTATKQALLNCFQHVAWIDENGQEYYDALYDALYNIPVSITATFLQGSNVIYNTDPLSVLRQYLVVRATYEDDTVQTVTAYTLSGNLTVGTSTITVAYKGRTATFEVTVTQAQSYITASYTPGTETVYTDDPLDSLKDNLVVTYYSNQDAQGVIVPAGDYILSGTLVAGTSTVLVNYNGNSTTFTVTGVIDFYNIWVWDSATDSTMVRASEAATNYDVGAGATYRYRPAQSVDNPNRSRTSFWVNKGKTGTNAVYINTGTAISDVFLIPVPATATQATFTLTPNTQYGSLRPWTYIGGGNWERENETGWKEGTFTLAFTDARENRYITINCKASAASEDYNDSTYPRPSIRIEFA